MKNKNKAAIAVEGILTRYSLEGGSSRVTADRIVDTVLRIMSNRKVKVPKPWEAFKVGNVSIGDVRRLSGLARTL